MRTNAGNSAIAPAGMHRIPRRRKKGRFRVLFVCKHAAYAFCSGFGRGFFFFFAAEKPNLPIFLPRAKYSPCA